MTATCKPVNVMVFLYLRKKQIVLIRLTQQIGIWRCVAWNLVTHRVHQGSLWEGAVSQRLTEGESPGSFDA